MADGYLNFNTKIDESGFNKGTKDITNSLGNLKGMLGKIAVAAAAAFSVTKLVQYGKQTVKLASDLQEVQNVVDVAFGDMSYKMEEFADNSIEQFGMSKLAAKQTGSSYMAMAAGMGMASDAASDMAIELTGLSADMASFYNISQDEARTALSSVFTGETETLKRYGILITEVNLEEYARQQGITKSIDKMTQQEKVMLRYNYVLNSTKLAQGDFARTSDSWANQTRMLSEKWKEFSATIGKVIMNVALPVVKTLNSAMSALINTASSLAKSLGLDSVTESASASSSAIESAVSNEEDLTDAVNDTAKANKKVLAGFDELNVLSDNSDTSNVGSVASAGSVESPALDSSKTEQSINNFTDGIKNAFKDIQEYFKKYQPSFDAWGDAFGNIKQSASDAFEKVKDSTSNLWNNGIKPLGKYLLDDFAPDCVNAWSEAFAPISGDIVSTLTKELGNNFEFNTDFIVDNVIPRLTKGFEFIKTVWSDVMGGIKGAWDKHGGGIINGISDFCQSIRDIFTSLWENFLSPLVDGIAETIKWLWDKHLKSLWDNITNFVGSLIEFVLAIWNNYLAPWFDWLVTVFGPIISAVINSIGQVIGTIFGVISDVVGGILRALSGLMDFITGIFTGDWKKAWGGIKDFFKGIWDAIWGVIKGVINLIIDALNLLWGAIYGVVSGIINGIGKIAGAIGSLLGKDWEFKMPAKPPYIPKLATGAVIPGGSPFLAMLGDQKAGQTNIETPAPLMLDMFKQALSEWNPNFTMEATGSMAQLIRLLDLKITESHKMSTVL